MSLRLDHLAGSIWLWIGAALHAPAHGSIAATAGPHSFGYWVTVLGTVGTLSSGWSCVLIRIANRACRGASDAVTRIAWEYESARGALRHRYRLILWLWRELGLGDWKRDKLALGEWTAAGALVGLSIAVFIYWLQG